MKKNEMKNVKLLWNFSKLWRINEGELFIEDKKYELSKEKIEQIYFLSQKEVCTDTLLNECNIDKEVLMELINDKILIDRIQEPKELFSHFNKLFFKEYQEETFIDPNLYKKFKMEKLQRNVVDINNDEEIQLDNIIFSNEITARKSYRKFSATKKISKEELSTIFSVFRQYSDNGIIRYNYATDGGLYPIDLYFYIKDKKVENLNGGLYVYEPIKNVIKLVSKSCILPKNMHYSTNTDIFENSAITIFFIFNSYVTMPKYKGLSYHYATIDCGIMVQLLTSIIEKLENIGLCSIGDINFDKVKKFFNLSKYQVLLHTIELGKYDEV